MSLPDRNNPYGFEEFLERTGNFDFYANDPFLQNVLRHSGGDEWPLLDAKLRKFSRKASFRWRPLTDAVARLEKRPFMEHYDAFNRRVDRIVRCAETVQLEREIFGEALFSRQTSPWEHLTKRYLLHQLGEYGVMCPIACTEGLVALIERFKDDVQPEVRLMQEHCTEGIDGDFGIGAQFITEIQGGSDIPSNLLEARPENGHYRLYGTKFFCSAVHADYAVVTAKVTGSEKVGTFVVPAWLPGDKPREIRNGYTINRLKWKMGTAELPTAELTYDGAAAYAIGPTDRGVANAVGIVLTLSRIAVGVSSAAAMTRAAREALLYSEFRNVFGRRICQHPLANHQVRELVAAAQRTTAAAFKIYQRFNDLGRQLSGGLSTAGTPQTVLNRFVLRELIIMQKLVAAHEAVDVIRKAMSLFGGNGVIEDFSSLPRLYRDAAVNELWEGPRNVLLMQVLRDLAKAGQFVTPAEFAAALLGEAPQAIIGALAEELAAMMNEIPADTIDDRGRSAAVAWEDFVVRLFRAYQDQALAEFGPVSIVAPDLLLFPEVWGRSR
jgi:putative acyl-CoA dehydrogenase